jgi:hypothetical protein
VGAASACLRRGDFRQLTATNSDVRVWRPM